MCVGPIQTVSSRRKRAKTSHSVSFIPRGTARRLSGTSNVCGRYAVEKVSDTGRFRTPVLQVCVRQSANYSEVVVAPLSVFYNFCGVFQVLDLKGLITKKNRHG